MCWVYNTLNLHTVDDCTDRTVLHCISSPRTCCMITFIVCNISTCSSGEQLFNCMFICKNLFHCHNMQNMYYSHRRSALVVHGSVFPFFFRFSSRAMNHVAEPVREFCSFFIWDLDDVRSAWSYFSQNITNLRNAGMQPQSHDPLQTVKTNTEKNETTHSY